MADTWCMVLLFVFDHQVEQLYGVLDLIKLLQLHMGLAPAVEFV